MKRWAIFTVFLYALALVILSLPVVSVGMGKWSRDDNVTTLTIGDDLVSFYSQWGYWLWLAVLLAGQALLLLLPINIAERRLPARRPLKIPVIVTAFFLANLCFAGIFSILCVIYNGKVFDYYNLVALFHSESDQNAESNGIHVLFTMILTVVVFWVIWAVIFSRRFGNDESAALHQRLTRWLLRGSILELLIAVPSHVIVRRRDDCCAPMGTFWGITTGLSVMLLCFGPGVFFLFAERCRKLKPKSATSEKTA